MELSWKNFLNSSQAIANFFKKITCEATVYGDEMNKTSHYLIRSVANTQLEEAAKVFVSHLKVAYKLDNISVESSFGGVTIKVDKTPANKIFIEQLEQAKAAYIMTSIFQENPIIARALETAAYIGGFEFEEKSTRHQSPFNNMHFPDFQNAMAAQGVKIESEKGWFGPLQISDIAKGSIKSLYSFCKNNPLSNQNLIG